MLSMNTFDMLLMHFGIIYGVYLVYVNSPFRKDVDDYVSNFCKRMNDKCPFMQHAFGFFSFLNEMNLSLIVDYEELFSEKEKEKETSLIEEAKSKNSVNVEIKFEEKYLEKMRQFPNDYVFSDEEIEQIKNNAEKMRVDNENDKRKKMEDVMGELEHIRFISHKVNVVGLKEEECVRLILEFHQLETDDENDDEMMKELFDKMNEQQNSLEEELHHLENQEETLEQFEKKAYDEILEKKLTGMMNNYVCEHTPLGNVFMRYNQEKGSFEYFSNSTIPYRYLEPIGRKYVMSYHCKPLFFDLEEELKKSEEKMKEKKEEQKKEEQKKPSAVFANFRKYNTNKESHVSVPSAPSKNRAPTSGNLPSHMKVNLPNVNNVSDKEKMILKEHANRYTYEGRLSNLSIVKKINRKLVDKKYAMTFAEFKKMQEQNKKSQ